MTHYNEHEGQTCPLCGDTMTATHSNYAPVWSDRHDNIVCTTCAETTEKDPTPPHGTPRPKAYPCAWFACASFTAQPLSLCEVHAEFSEFGHAVEFLETWVSDSADLDNKTDRTASMVLDQVLNTLYGAFMAWKCDDLQGLDLQMEKAAGLFGFVACETCLGLAERVELDVNGLCEMCRDEAEHA